jgi:hypothetical protein
MRMGCTTPYVSDLHAHSMGPKRKRRNQMTLAPTCGPYTRSPSPAAAAGPSRPNSAPPYPEHRDLGGAADQDARGRGRGRAKRRLATGPGREEARSPSDDAQQEQGEGPRQRAEDERRDVPDFV